MARGGFRPGAGRPRKSGSKPKPEFVDTPNDAKRPLRAPKQRAAKVPADAGPAEQIGAAAQRVLDQAAKDPEKACGRKFRDALDFAMAVMNGEVEGADMPDKVRLAVAAMPFQHAKLAEKPATKGETKAERAKSAASGKFAPPPPPGSRPKVVVDNG
jgi:hypothetical protein